MPANQNRLYYGDNLDILRKKIKSETVDLCYIDPPFNSKRNYNQIYNNIGEEDRAQAQIGTVEGKLEGLITHGRSRIFIYDPLTGHQVTCYFSDRISLDDVLKSYGKRVAVTGLIRSRRSGERVDIQANRFEVLPTDDELPSAADVLGILKAAR